MSNIYEELLLENYQATESFWKGDLMEHRKTLQPELHAWAGPSWRILALASQTVFARLL